MQPSQLHTLPPEQAALLVRKKRFWKRMMWSSLSIVIAILAIGINATLNGIEHTYNSSIEATGTIDAKTASAGISESLGKTTRMLPFAAAGILLFLTALIRTLSLPKLPAPPPGK